MKRVLLFCGILLAYACAAFGENAAQWAGQAGYVVSEENFVEDLDALVYHFEELQGVSVYIEGYAELYGEGDDDLVQFAVIRDYLDYDEEEVYPVGIDCAWPGELPEEEAWVQVIGTLATYQPEGDEDSYIKLNVISYRVIPDGEHGSRLIFR